MPAGSFCKALLYSDNSCEGLPACVFCFIGNKSITASIGFSATSAKANFIP
jgi:hypothetical protein